MKIEYLSSLKPSLMEAKGIAILQRVTGDDNPGGSSLTTVRYRESTGRRTEIELGGFQWDEPATQGKVLYPFQALIRILGVHVLKDTFTPGDLPCTIEDACIRIGWEQGNRFRPHGRSQQRA